MKEDYTNSNELILPLIIVYREPFKTTINVSIANPAAFCTGRQTVHDIIGQQWWWANTELNIQSRSNGITNDSIANTQYISVYCYSSSSCLCMFVDKKGDKKRKSKTLASYIHSLTICNTSPCSRLKL